MCSRTSPLVSPLSLEYPILHPPLAQHTLTRGCSWQLLPTFPSPYCAASLSLQSQHGAWLGLLHTVHPAGVQTRLGASGLSSPTTVSPLVSPACIGHPPTRLCDPEHSSLLDTS